MNRQDVEKEQDLLRQIATASEAIRKKYQKLKTGRIEADQALSDMLKPVVTPLKALVEKKEIEEPVVKKEKERDVKMEIEEPMIDLRQTRQAIPPKHLDKTWGVYDRKGHLMLGNSPVQTQGNQLTVAGDTYTLTPGLLELLLKKNPELRLVSPQDWDHYEAIVTATHIQRRSYRSNGKPRTSSMEKVQRLVLKAGEGLSLPHAMLVNRNHKTDYVYWDDPEELVERLQLLIASYNVGNHSHTNEIMSLLEELREADLIE